MGNNLRFSQHSPCDYMMFDGHAGIFYALELKSFKGACSFERDKKDKGTIHFHQIESLKKFNSYKNVVAGFVLDFRDSDSTYFLPITEFCRMAENIDKKSFNESDMLKWCDPMKIGKRKLRVNYRYDIEGFVKNMRSKVAMA